VAEAPDREGLLEKVAVGLDDGEEQTVKPQNVNRGPVPARSIARVSSARRLDDLCLGPHAQTAQALRSGLPRADEPGDFPHPPARDGERQGGGTESDNDPYQHL